MVPWRPAAVLVVAVDEVGVGVVVEGDDDLRVLPLLVLRVVFDVTDSGLVEGELAVAVRVVIVDDGGHVLRCRRRNRRSILHGWPLMYLKKLGNVQVLGSCAIIFHREKH